MNWKEQSRDVLRTEVQKRKLGSATWRISASKDELVAALEASDAGQELPKTEPAAPKGDKQAAVRTLLDLLSGEGLDEERVRAIAQDEVSKAYKPVIVEIKKPDGTKKDLGVQHKQFPRLLSRLQAGLHVWLGGPAGTGKTQAAHNAAKALDLPFFSQSVCAQTTKTDLFGFVDAHGKYHPSAFRKAYEKGGLFLLDEVDAGNANVMVLLNAALANSGCTFPDTWIDRSEDFRLVAAGNTWGHGASREYMGRNQIDAATLNRFCRIDWQTDEGLEDALVADKKWLALVRKYRKTASEKKLRVLVTQRTAIYGQMLLSHGVPLDEACEDLIFEGLDADTLAKLKG